MRAEAKKKLANGIDPGQEKKDIKLARQVSQANSFESVAREWHKQWSPSKNPRYAVSVLSRLEAGVFPVIGSKPIADIRPLDLVAMGKKTEARGASDVAKRNHDVCSAVFRYGIAHGLLGRNAASEVKTFEFLKSYEKKNFARISKEQLPDYLTKVDAYPGGSLVRLAMKLMNLTFLRTSEFIGAKWTEIDFENARWNVPGERMKVKVQGHHVVPLSRQAIETLRALQVISGNRTYVFPGERDPANKCMSNNTILAGIKRIGYKGYMTGHGYRGLASTLLNEANFVHEHVERQLAHGAKDRVAAAYNHAKYLPQRTLMMQWWADYLDLARSGHVFPYPPLPNGYVSYQR
jgi:integrase